MVVWLNAHISRYLTTSTAHTTTANPNPAPWPRPQPGCVLCLPVYFTVHTAPAPCTMILTLCIAPMHRSLCYWLSVGVGMVHYAATTPSITAHGALFYCILLRLFSIQKPFHERLKSRPTWVTECSAVQCSTMQCAQIANATQMRMQVR